MDVITITKVLSDYFYLVFLNIDYMWNCNILLLLLDVLPELKFLRTEITNLIL